MTNRIKANKIKLQNNRKSSSKLKKIRGSRNPQKINRSLPNKSRGSKIKTILNLLLKNQRRPLTRPKRLYKRNRPSNF